jgi:Tfp pilus assembly protein FimT
VRKQRMNFPKKQPKLTSVAGVSVVELLLVIRVVAVISAIAVISFQTSSRSFKVAGATRNLSAYLEKAGNPHAGNSIEGKSR